MTSLPPRLFSNLRRLEVLETDGINATVFANGTLEGTNCGAFCHDRTSYEDGLQGHEVCNLRSGSDQSMLLRDMCIEQIPDSSFLLANDTSVAGILAQADGVVRVSGNHPEEESPAHALDGLVETKYLSFDGGGSGIRAGPVARGELAVGGGKGGGRGGGVTEMRR
jgi:hypothetical protein